MAEELTYTARRQKERVIMLTISETRSDDNGNIGYNGLADKRLAMTLFTVPASMTGGRAFCKHRHEMPAI
jgi:hypothetical protein